MNLFKTTLLGCALSVGVSEAAHAKPRTPARNSPERRAIMNAMRRVVGPRFRKPIVFTAQHFKVDRGWAFFKGDYDYADGTRWPVEEGPGGSLDALLHFERGVWRVKYSIEAGDPQEADIVKRFPQAPLSIFTSERFLR